MRVWALSGGVYNELHDEDVVLNSNGLPSITFNYTDQGYDLSGQGDGIVVRLLLSSTGGAPDGNWNFLSFKLEEGNTYTGYEPTPYAVDELECQKWFYQLDADDAFSPITMVKQFSATAMIGAVPFPVKMYAQPSLVISSTSDFRLVDGNVAALTNLQLYTNTNSASGAIQATATGLGTDFSSMLTFDGSSGFMQFSCEL
jgi:hypothetical protein